MTILTATGVSRFYGAHRALACTTVRFEPGSFTAIVGGNGAGKSTLLNLLGGVVSPSAGEVRFGEQKISSVRSALRQGISFAHQEIALIPDWTVADHFPAQRTNTTQVWRDLAPAIDADSFIRDLPGHDLQCLEVARALAVGTRVILADEPTAALGAVEKQRVLETLAGAAASGRTVIWVTHDLPSALAFAHRMTVLRDGAVVAEVSTRELTIEKILDAMSAHSASERQQEFQHNTRTDTAFGEGHERAIRFDLGDQRHIEARSGEVVGLTGDARSGARDVLRAAIGLNTTWDLHVSVGGSPVKREPRSALSAGIVYMSRERGTEWLFSRQSVAFNIAAGVFPDLCNSFSFRETQMLGFAKTWTGRFDVKAPSLDTEIEGLSGGNRQKTVLARLAAMRPAFMLLDEPFSGVDPPTRLRLFALLRDMADKGVGIVIYSQESADLVNVTDRVLVMSLDGIEIFRSRETTAAQVERAVLSAQGRAA